MARLVSKNFRAQAHSKKFTRHPEMRAAGKVANPSFRVEVKIDLSGLADKPSICLREAVGLRAVSSQVVFRRFNFAHHGTRISAPGQSHH